MSDDLVVRVSNAMLKCRCGVHASFSGDVELIQKIQCPGCATVGRFSGWTVKERPSKNQQFYDYEDSMPLSVYTMEYLVWKERISQERIERGLAVGSDKIDAAVAKWNAAIAGVSNVREQFEAERAARGESSRLVELNAELYKAVRHSTAMKKKVDRLRADVHYVAVAGVVGVPGAVSWVDPLSNVGRHGTVIALPSRGKVIVECDKFLYVAGEPLVPIRVSTADSFRVTLPMMDVSVI